MSARKAVDTSLDRQLPASARALKLNHRRAVEDALCRKVRQVCARRWRKENAEPIRLSNNELERNGLWSDGLRLF